MTNRQTLRQQLRKQRDELSPIEQLTASITIAEHLTEHSIFKNSQTIAGYCAIGNEISPQPIIESAWQENKSCYLPTLGDKSLKFALYQSDTQLQKNRLNIPEPTTRQYIEPQQLDIVLVPLVGVDTHGNRLGMGAGFYDRTFSFLLDNPSLTKPVLIGLGYEWQIIENLETEKWDVPLQAVVTENGIISF